MIAIKIDAVIITKNSQETLENTLKSIQGLIQNIFIIDDYSTDKTIKIAKKYKAKIYLHHEYNLGKQKAFGISKTKNDWILLLDSDEVVSTRLKKEIIRILESSRSNSGLPRMTNYIGYFIPYQNHYLGRKLYFGGENYIKLRLFNKKFVTVDPVIVHEDMIINKGKIGKLKNHIYHYSYRSLIQMYKKFTDYAIKEAKQKKAQGEKTSLEKIFLYAPHMFWARFIEDKGHKDGLFRIPLDLGFAYMEFLTYTTLFFLNLKRKK